MGSIYKRGSIFWIKYYRQGRPYRESSHSDLITYAQRLLRKREGEIAEGKQPGIYFDRVTFDELAQDFITDYRINGKDTLSQAERFVNSLSESFKGMKVVNIGTDKIKDYIDKGMREGMANASINREPAALKRMFHLAAQSTPPKVNLIPYIPMLKENNVRRGFFEYNEYATVRDNAGDDFRPVVIFGYHTGCRIDEILGLPIDKVDSQGMVRFEDTKNGDDRELCFNGIPELKEAIENNLKNSNGSQWLFHKRDGSRFTMYEYRKAWNDACTRSGFFKEVIYNGQTFKVATKLFHDFRRTAIRNMVRSGIPESVAMQISGHKTRAVFERYNITSGRDLREASKKMGAYFERQSNQRVVLQFPVQKEAIGTI